MAVSTMTIADFGAPTAFSALKRLPGTLVGRQLFLALDEMRRDDRQPAARSSLMIGMRLASCTVAVSYALFPPKQLVIFVFRLVILIRIKPDACARD